MKSGTGLELRQIFAFLAFDIIQLIRNQQEDSVSAGSVDGFVFENLRSCL